MENTAPARERIGRGFELTLCACGVLWSIAAAILSHRAASGIAVKLRILSAADLLSAVFFIFLLVLGFQLLDWISIRRSELNEALLLPLRPGWRKELALGAALGWGIAVAAALPVLLTGSLHGVFGLRPGDASLLLLELVTCLTGTLAVELVFRGYLFERLAGATGPAWAAVLTSALFALFEMRGSRPPSPFFALLDAFLLGLLLATALLRTRALWVSWGIHFFFRSVTLILLGLPLAGRESRVSVVQMYTAGPAWLTGSVYGLNGTVLTGAFLLAAVSMLYRYTREYAWHYTYRPAAAAGYAMVVLPPQQQLEMERAAAAPPALVQILPLKNEPSGVPLPPSGFHNTTQS